jgi:hypothetical protein
MAFTTGQAGGQVQQLAVPTAYAGDAQELARAQRLAQLLSGQQMPEGQMVSGRYVKPSWTQQLAGLVNAGTGAYFADQAEKQNLALAKKIREGENAALADYMAEVEGRPATPDQVTQMAGPYGQGVGQNGANVPMPTATIAGRAAIPANPRAANLNAAQNDMLPSWMRQFAMKEVTKGPDWKEISQYNEKTGNTETYRYNQNSPDPKSTMQFLGISKPAMSQAETIRLRDEGLLPSGSGNMSVGGGNAPIGGVSSASNNAPMGGGGSPANPSAKPVAAKNDEVVKAFGYNPFEAPKPPPTLTSGPQLRKFYSDQAGALPAETQKTVRGAINYQKAVGELQDEFQKYTEFDLAKPSVRANLKQKVTNAYLLGKEANTLGALTGPDLGLLEKLVFDPTSFDSLILDRKTINSLYDAQRRSAGDTIRESYRQDKKPVPEDMRNNILVKAKELPMSQAEIKKAVIEKGIKYDPAYEYKIDSDGNVDRKKKK